LMSKEIKNMIKCPLCGTKIKRTYTSSQSAFIQGVVVQVETKETCPNEQCPVEDLSLDMNVKAEDFVDVIGKTFGFATDSKEDEPSYDDLKKRVKELEELWYFQNAETPETEIFNKLEQAAVACKDTFGEYGLGLYVSIKNFLTKANEALDVGWRERGADE